MSDVINGVSRELLERAERNLCSGEEAYRTQQDLRALLTAQPQAITDDMVNAASSVIVGFSGEYGEYNEYLSEEAAREVLEAALSVAPQASAAQSAPAGEREAFEAAVVKVALANGYSYMGELLKRDAEGSYRQSWVDSSWLVHQAWQRAQSAPVVPEGYVLVPADPTPEMIRAGVLESVGALRVYFAMLAAAPQPAARQEQGDAETPAPYGWVAAGQFFTAREDAADAAGKTPCVEVYSLPQLITVLARSTERQAVAEELARLLKQSGDEVRRLREALEEIRHANMNAPVSESNAGCIKRIKQIAERALSASAEGK